MKRCRVCAIKLTTPTNWYPSSARKSDYVCKSCLLGGQHQYYKRNRQRIVRRVAKYNVAYKPLYRAVHRDEMRAYSLAYDAAHREERAAKARARYWSDIERFRREGRERARDLIGFRPLKRQVMAPGSRGLRLLPCSVCGGRTKKMHLHHDKYDPANPLAHTRVLCASCHPKHHAAERRRRA